MKKAPQTGSKRPRGRFFALALVLLALLAGCAAKAAPPTAYLCLPVVVQTPDGATPAAYCRPHEVPQ